MTAVERPDAAATGQFMAVADRLVTLYSLDEQWQHLIDLYEDPERDEAAIDAELARVASDIKAKGRDIAIVLQGLDHKAGEIKREEERLYAKRKAVEANAERLRAYTLEHLKSIGVDRLDYGVFTLSIRTNPPAVTVVDAAAVPSNFQRTRIDISVDKRAILEEFKRTGELVPGVTITRSDRLATS